VFLLCSYFDKK